MPYKVQLETRARHELLGLPKEVRQRLVEVIDSLVVNPRPVGAKKLIGQEGYRIRKGDYRLLYAIDDSQQVVSVYRIGHRREVYR